MAVAGNMKRVLRLPNSLRSDLLLVERAIARVDHLHLILANRRHDVFIAFDMSYDRPDMNQITRPIGGPVGVNVTARRKPGRHANAGQIDDIRGERTAGDGEHAHVTGGFQLFVFMSQYTVVAGGRFGEHLFAVGQQQPHAGPRFASFHVFSEHEHLVARRLDDHIQIALQHQRRGRQRFAADRYGHRAAGSFAAFGVGRQRNVDLISVCLYSA